MDHQEWEFFRSFFEDLHSLLREILRELKRIGRELQCRRTYPRPTGGRIDVK